MRHQWKHCWNYFECNTWSVASCSQYEESFIWYCLQHLNSLQILISKKLFFNFVADSWTVYNQLAGQKEYTDFETSNAF